jgi:hypothetical protein
MSTALATGSVEDRITGSISDAAATEAATEAEAAAAAATEAAASAEAAAVTDRPPGSFLQGFLLQAMCP